MIRVLLFLTLAACAAQTPNPRSVLTRQALDTMAQPTLLAELPDLKVAATLAPSGRNGGVETWASGDAVSLSFRQGVIVASRGLGADLMTADVDGSLRMLRGRTTGYYTRLHSYLNGEYQTVFRAFQCRKSTMHPERIVLFSRAHQTMRIEEICATPGQTITNIYWIGPDGFLWKSRQWVSAHAGYLLTEHLVR